MSKIEELIERLCPEGVEWKTLGEIGEFKYGFTDRARSHGTARFVRITDISENGKLRKADARFVDLTNVNKEYLLRKGDVLMARTGATYGKTMLFNENYDAVYASFLIRIRFKEENILPSYYWHFAQSSFYWDQAIKLVGGGAQPQFNANVLKQITLPIPPLEIQNEIVSILDKFTLLEAELEAELEARKTQYEHYRNALLSFEAKNVEWKTLGEVGTFIRGNGLQKKDFTETGVGCIHYGQIYTYYGTYTNKTKSFVSPELAKRLKKAAKNDLIIAGVSENVEDVCKAVVWLGEEEICVSGDTFIFKHKQNPKYIAYQFQTKAFLEFKKKYAIGAKVTRIQSGKLPTYQLPLPSLGEQERIVNILDKFDALVNDISIGLPAEIEARRKQYEYYRNRLLTFTCLNQDLQD